MAIYCPITGCPITTRPEWTNRRVSDTFTANFWVIGDNIIYSRPHGSASAESIRASLLINDEVVEFVSRSCRSHIQIEDYSHIKGAGSDSETRRIFISRMVSDERLSALIFCNLTTALSIAVNLGKRLNVRGHDAYVVKSYDEAVQRAYSLGNAQQSKSARSPVDLRAYVGSNVPELQPVDVSTDDVYSFVTPDWSARGVLIDRSVLHTTNVGYLESKHAPLLDEYHRQIDAHLGDAFAVQYIVVNIADVSGASHSARLEYMGSLRRWHQRTPFRMYIAYGADTLQKTALMLGKALMPFKVRIAKDREHAFRLINEDQKQKSPKKRKPKKLSQQLVSTQDVQDFLAYIGKINWDAKKHDDPAMVSEQHPFSVLYQSVDLVKEEIGEIFDTQNKIEVQLRQAQKMESVGRFAAGVAHDINNILCIISGNTQLALHDLDKDSPVRENLEDAKQATERAEDIVKQLLEFSRTQDHQYKPIDAVAVIKDALRLLRTTVPSMVEIKESLPDVSISISSDETQINQILMNLFANAAHSMEHSGGVLEVSVDRKLVLDDIQGKYAEIAAGEYLQLTVTDTGAGISADHIDRIFDPYFTTKGIGRGSGLGLAVVLGIVKTHGGTISVVSEPGQGATFTLLFPILKVAARPVAESSPILQRGSETILVVDDEVAVANLLQKILLRLGYSAEMELSPVEAIKRVDQNPEHFDLIITDMTMPGMTGVELSAKVKALCPDMPIIICTGYSPLIDDEKAAELGIAALALKPLEMQDLAAIVRQVLDANPKATPRVTRPARKLS